VLSRCTYEGRTCPLAKFGHDRDGQKGLPIIVYGVVTNALWVQSSARCSPYQSH
jgi:hypothetical protein